MKVSKHAIERYRQRTGTRKDDEWIKDRIQERLLNSIQITHKNPSLAALSLMQNSYVRASYFCHGDLIFVVVEETVVTVHHGEAKRWRIAPS